MGKTPGRIWHHRASWKFLASNPLLWVRLKYLRIYIYIYINHSSRLASRYLILTQTNLSLFRYETLDAIMENSSGYSALFLVCLCVTKVYIYIRIYSFCRCDMG